VAILKRHLVDKVPVSDLCDELGLNPTVFYGWQKQFLENRAAALQRKGKRSSPTPEARKIEKLGEEKGTSLLLASRVTDNQ